MLIEKPKDEIRDAVNAVLAVCTNLSRGDVLAHEVIEEAIDCRRYEGRWKLIIHKFRRKLLRERGIACRPVVTVGYKLLSEQEQLTWCARNRQRRALKQLGRGVMELESLPVDTLLVHQQRLRALSIDNMKTERRLVMRCTREQAREVRDWEGNPRRPTPAAG